MPKRDLQRRIDLRPTTGGRGLLSNVSSHGGGDFDDDPLVRRDGSHSLYGAAQWLWETGAEVAVTLRSWGDGLLQIFGSLYAGRVEGPAVGIWQITNADDVSVLFQAKDTGNVPFVSFGAMDDDNVEHMWGNIGYEGYPRIYFGFKDPYERQVPLLPTELLEGQIDLTNINVIELASNFPIPIVDTLDGLAFQEGQLFALRLGLDTGALYMWTRWGPEPQGGFHRAGPHNHASFDEGEQLLLSTSMSDVQIVAPAHDDVLVYNSIGGYWYNDAVSLGGGSDHDAVTLGTDAQEILNLSTQTIGLVTQTANQVLAGPAAGGASDPDFRALVVADLPTVTRTRTIIFTVSGVLEIGIVALRMPNHLGSTATITGVYLDISTAPTGSDLIIDIHKDGTTIFTNQAHRPTIVAGNTSGNTVTIDVSTWVDSSYLTLEIDQIGGTIAGADLTCTVAFTI